MPEPQIVIVVNSLTEAHKLERELVRDRQNACGYRPRHKKMNAGFVHCKQAFQPHTPNNSTFMTPTISVAARGKRNDFKTIYWGNQ